MKIYLFVLFSSITIALPIFGIYMPPPLARINEVSFYLSHIIKKDFDDFAQNSPQPEVLAAKKNLYSSTIQTLNHIRRLASLHADPITLHSAIKGIISMPLVYTAEPPVLYVSHKAQFERLSNGKLKVIENTHYFTDHMLEIVRPYCPQ